MDLTVACFQISASTLRSQEAVTRCRGGQGQPTPPTILSHTKWACFFFPCLLRWECANWPVQFFFLPFWVVLDCSPLGGSEKSELLVPYMTKKGTRVVLLPTASSNCLGLLANNPCKSIFTSKKPLKKQV